MWCIIDLSFESYLFLNVFSHFYIWSEHIEIWHSTVGLASLKAMLLWYFKVVIFPFGHEPRNLLDWKSAVTVPILKDLRLGKDLDYYTYGACRKLMKFNLLEGNRMNIKVRLTYWHSYCSQWASRIIFFSFHSTYECLCSSMWYSVKKHHLLKYFNVLPD